MNIYNKPTEFQHCTTMGIRYSELPIPVYLIPIARIKTRNYNIDSFLMNIVMIEINRCTL